MIKVKLPQNTMNGKIPANLKKFILYQPIFESYLVKSQTSRMSYFSTQDRLYPNQQINGCFLPYDEN